MKVKKYVRITLLLSLLIFLTAQQTSMVAVAQEQPSVIDVQQLTFFDQMRANMALYNVTGFWALKVFPTDQLQLFVTESPIYVEVYVSDIDAVNQSSVDIQTVEVQHVFQVYRASKQSVSQLSAIPHTHFYVSAFSPSIGMTVEKQVLEQIAKVPSVYCIRIIPNHAQAAIVGDTAYLNAYSFDALWFILILVVVGIILVFLGLKIKKRRQYQ
jgi:hypothetical protein